MTFYAEFDVGMFGEAYVVARTVLATWKEASYGFAARTKGDIKIIQSDAVRIKSVWVEVEFLDLESNRNGNCIIAINTATGVKTLLCSK